MKYLNSTPLQGFQGTSMCHSTAWCDWLPDKIRMTHGSAHVPSASVLASVSGEASARALQRTRTVASRCLVHRDIGMAGGRTRVACVVMAGDDPLKSLIRQANVWISAGWASYLYPRNDQKWKCSCIYYYIIYNTPCNVYIYIYTVSTHLYIHHTCESYVFFCLHTFHLARNRH